MYGIIRPFPEFNFHFLVLPIKSSAAVAVLYGSVMAVAGSKTQLHVLPSLGLEEQRPEGDFDGVFHPEHATGQ